MVRLSALALTFVLGACAGAAVSTRAEAPPPPPPSPAAAPAAAPAVAASVVNLADVTKRSPPGSKASIAVLAEGQEAFLGLLEMPGGGAVPEHRDPTEEYIYVLEGSGTITVDGAPHALSPGSAVFMPAGATVSYQNGEQALVALQVFAGPESAAKYAAWE